MKHILLIPLLLIVFNCKAQLQQTQNIIPVENKIDYNISETEVPDGTYFKDVNHLFDKFIGTWTGSYNNRDYEYVVTKITHNFLGISIDELLMKYKITDTNGTVIADTTILPDDSVYVIEGSYFHENEDVYQLSYIGLECYYLGDLVIAVINNGTQMNMRFVPALEYDCTQQINQAPELMPSSIVLNKQ